MKEEIFMIVVLKHDPNQAQLESLKLWLQEPGRGQCEPYTSKSPMRATPSSPALVTVTLT